MADPTWTRHELPNGERSLWFRSPTEWWHTIQDRKDLGAPCLFFARTRAPRECWDEDVAVKCGQIACPTPTADDLAWLRGAK